MTSIIDKEELINQAIQSIQELSKQMNNQSANTPEDKLQQVYNQLQSCLTTLTEFDNEEFPYSSITIEELNLQISRALRLVIKQANQIGKYKFNSTQELAKFKEKVLDLIVEIEGEKFYSKVLTKLAVSNKPFEQVVLEEVNKLGEVSFNNFVKRVREIKSIYQFPTKLKELTFFPGRYVDDIKILPCLIKRDGEYFPLDMYAIVKNGESIGQISKQDLKDALASQLT